MAIAHSDTETGIGLASMSLGGSTYIVESFDPSPSLNLTETQDQDGNANGSFGTAGLTKATAILQANAAADVPARGDTATYEGDDWKVTTVSKPRKMAEQHKWSVEFVEELNA